MSFATFSSDFLMETFTLVDNLFINEHLPYCDEKQIKVYLYGLYMCANPQRDNSISTLCSVLNLSENEVMSVYKYFEDMGLVQVVSNQPFEVRYLCLKRSMQLPKKYKSEKWNDFNMHLQQLFAERMLTPNELNEYYSFLDDSKLEHDAMLMIVQYCINLKGMSVRYPYILTVARNWVADGVRTVADVENRLNEYSAQTEQMQQVLCALGRKTGAELEEKQMLTKWTKSWGYEMDAILTAAKALKGNKSFKKLDQKLDEYYRLSIFTAQEMADYLARREHLKSLAISINKTLGIYYESFDHEIEVYIVPWTAKGFDDDALLRIAHHCFISNVRTLDAMNNVVNKFYSLGLLSLQSIEQYIAEQIQTDNRIHAIIESTGRNRNVTAADRDYYRTWTSWGFDDEIILFVAQQAQGKPYPISFINQTLSAYKSHGINTIDKAQDFDAKAASKAHAKDYQERNYTKDEVQSIITSIDSLSDTDI